MPYKKGQSGNPDGRKKEHRTSEQLRGLIQSFIEDNLQCIQADFDAMKPDERLAFLNNLLRHVLPEPTTIEKLTEAQLEQLHEYLLKKYTNVQAVKN